MPHPRQQRPNNRDFLSGIVLILIGSMMVYLSPSLTHVIALVGYLMAGVGIYLAATNA